MNRPNIPSQEDARTLLRMEEFVPTNLRHGSLINSYLWPILQAYAEGRLIDRDDALAACVDCEMSFNNTQRFADKFPIEIINPEEKT